MKIFHFQQQNCEVYAKWIQNRGIRVSDIKNAADIPYLPISFFKSQKVLVSPQHTGRYLVFESSSTTGSGVSRHWLPFADWYESVFQKTFDLFYTSTSKYCILALLPSYLDRPNSSLVYMADKLISSALPGSGFYRDDLKALQAVLTEKEEQEIPVLLLGVTYALLDFAAQYSGPRLQNTVVMETGGMKGRRKEMIRDEVHSMLSSKLGVAQIHSEYGMTELLSQAYANALGLFRTPPWMRVSTAQTSDPFSLEKPGKTGRICVADLANLYSCAFLATDDLGKIHASGAFEVAGRFDFSDTRGCNLMWE